MSDGGSPSASADRADVRPDAGSLDEHRVRCLARWLAEQHAAAPPARGPGSAELLERVLACSVRVIEERLPELAKGPLREIALAQRGFLAEHAERLRQREHGERVRAGPGPPLRLAELTVRDDGSVDRSQRAGPGEAFAPRDVCVDLGGVALDLARGGRSDFAERLLSAYAGAADDFELYGVIDFYERAGALDRALREALRSGDGGVRREPLMDDVRQHLLLALATRRRPLLPPVLVAVGGLVASGKSTLSRELAERLAAPRIEADRVRNFLLGDRPGRDVHEAQWAQSFEAGFEENVYAQMLRRAAVVLDSGRPLVIDACFPRAHDREAARALARRCRRPFLFVECRADPDTAHARLAKRDAETARPGWARIHRGLADRWEPTHHLASEEHVVVDTSGPVSQAASALEARLPSWPRGLGG